MVGDIRISCLEHGDLFILFMDYGKGAPCNARKMLLVSIDDGEVEIPVSDKMAEVHELNLPHNVLSQQVHNDTSTRMYLGDT